MSQPIETTTINSLLIEYQIPLNTCVVQRELDSPVHVLTYLQGVINARFIDSDNNRQIVVEVLRSLFSDMGCGLVVAFWKECQQSEKEVQMFRLGDVPTSVVFNTPQEIGVIGIGEIVVFERARSNDHDDDEFFLYGSPDIDDPRSSIGSYGYPSSWN